MFQRDEIPHWAGICNGWSLAAISTPEPDHSVTLDLTDGRRITFYVADIKALLSQLYNDFQELTPVKRIGARCSEANVKMEDGRIIDPDCRDVNPMSFHLALNDYLAKDKAFVIDVEPSEQVWNQPAYGYSMSLTPAQAVSTASPHHARGTVYTSKVEVNFQYIVESGPVRNKIIGTDFASQMIRSKLYAYTLELDENKRVIGGEWAAGTQGPDFMWVTDKTPSQESFRANYPLDVKTINHLLEQSLN